MSIEARIRRLQDTLIITGTAFIAFGAWTFVKTVLMMLLLDEETVHTMLQVNADIAMKYIFIAVAIASAIDIAVRAYVGLSARAEGHGKHKRVIYLIVGAILAISNAANLVLIIGGSSTSPTFFDTIMTAIIEATSFLTLVLIVFCSARLRQLRKNAE